MKILAAFLPLLFMRTATADTGTCFDNYNAMFRPQAVAYVQHALESSIRERFKYEYDNIGIQLNDSDIAIGSLVSFNRTEVDIKNNRYSDVFNFTIPSSITITANGKTDTFDGSVFSTLVAEDGVPIVISFGDLNYVTLYDSIGHITGKTCRYGMSILALTYQYRNHATGRGVVFNDLNLDGNAFPPVVVQ